MKVSNSLTSSLYKKYFVYGVVALLSVWIVALLTTAILPGPYRIDFFGVVAERSADGGSSVTLSWIAFASALIILPAILMAYDLFKKNRRIT